MAVGVVSRSSLEKCQFRGSQIESASARLLTWRVRDSPYGSSVASKRVGLLVALNT